MRLPVTSEELYAACNAPRVFTNVKGHVHPTTYLILLLLLLNYSFSRLDGGYVNCRYEFPKNYRKQD